MKETRYYIINIDQFRTNHPKDDPYHADKNIRQLSDDAFMTESETQGLVYTKKSFLYGFNEGFIDSKLTYLRIIDIPGACNGNCTGCEKC